jgi:hypothetical protein
MISLDKQFDRMGARVKVRPFGQNRWGRNTNGLGVSVDIRRDEKGEYFDLRLDDDHCDLSVLQVEPKDRHLLLLAKTDKDKFRYLCGHDERHWFVAAIPESTPVSTVKAAKLALQPDEVRGISVPSKYAARRKNKGWIRQGEWFFVPVGNKKFNWTIQVLKNEPMQRNDGGKPHYAEFLVRYGGEDVWVSRRYPSGVSDEEYTKIMNSSAEAKNWYWSRMRRNPEVYVKGKISHSDHATIILDGWHRVYMNTEAKARARASVVFLD